MSCNDWHRHAWSMNSFEEANRDAIIDLAGRVEMQLIYGVKPPNETAPRGPDIDMSDVDALIDAAVSPKAAIEKLKELLQREREENYYSEW